MGIIGLVILLRWIQWILSAYIFGATFAYLLTDVNWYLYFPKGFTAQVGIAGFLHIYMYMSLVWASCVRNLPLIWAVLDFIFLAGTIAIAGLGVPSIQTYCTNNNLLLQWSDTSRAFVLPIMRSSTDNSSLTNTLDKKYLQMACSFSIGVEVACALLV
jgi:hypothetical protein